MPILTFICPICLRKFTKRQIFYDRQAQKQGRDYQPKCSTECAQASQKRKSLVQEVICLNCGLVFSKTSAQIRKTTNHFCSRSCSASYNNRHKQHGTRRSKLEQYLEQQVKDCYPELPIVCNSKDLIASELDMYFPTLKLAIELNGILHYQPIYGQNKFEQIRDSDKQKLLRCRELGVELCVIDASDHSHLTASQKQKYWNTLEGLLSGYFASPSPNN